MEISDKQNTANLIILGQSWAEMIDNITHDLAPPLAIVNMSISLLKEMMDELIEGYELAIENNLLKPKSSKLEVTAYTEKTCSNIKEALNKISALLQLLHPWNKQILQPANDYPQLQIKNCIDAALKQCYFETEKQKSLITINCSNNFKFKADPLHVTQAISLLLEKALYSVASIQKAQIELSTEEDETHHYLHIKYPINNISLHDLAYFFEPYFIKNNGEIKPGIGFCRLALLQLGGDITRNSIKNNTMQFSIVLSKTVKIN